MTVAQARALCPAVRIIPFDPEKGRRALQQLAQWCGRFSPVVAVDPTPMSSGMPDETPDGLLLDVTGEAHLFGGEQWLVMEVAARLARLGLVARLALAPTIGAAWALARFGRYPASRVEVAGVLAALAELSVAALRLTADICAQLHAVNILRIGELLRLPRESLAARFGPELLLRVDQALGHAGELLQPYQAAETLSVRQLFEGATTQLEALELTLQELLGQLVKLLEAQESGVRGLQVEWLRVDAPPVSRVFVLNRPSRDPNHLWRLMRPKMESMHMGHGVEGVVLTANSTQRIVHKQIGGWDAADDTLAADYDAFLDMLINRWGNQRVLAAHPVASHLLELARQFRPVNQPACVSAEVPGADRPSLLLEHPEPAIGMALEPDHPPAWLQWRGQDYRLAAGTGPERIATAWWGGNGGDHRGSPLNVAGQESTRDYFKVCTPGGLWLWVFRELESGQWFVHGLWA